MELKFHGWEFKQLIPLSNTSKFNQFQPIAGSYAVLTCKKSFLLCYNTWRKQWELPAGKKEADETSLECARRELFEETGQEINTLKLIAVAELVHLNDRKRKYNPIFASEVSELQPFQVNDETSEIMLWDTFSSLSSVDAVDKRIIEEIHLLQGDA